MSNEIKKKKNLTKNEKFKLLAEGKENIEKLVIPLRNHTNRNKNIGHINHKIMHLLYDPFTFVNAYTKISKNQGAMTEGVDDEGTMRLFGLVTANRIAKSIKNNKYQFKPVRRNWIPKPGKKKKRPIDVPTQSDRIVQEALRGILEAIYEPEFKTWGITTKNLNNNYGFRPGKSTWSAMDKIKKYSQRCTIAIEGDILSAYNNVDHKILLSILKKRIKDKKFLNLIKQLLKCGVMDQHRYEDSITGTPQGGIVSPLLFNIYMFGLDQYVYHEIISPIIEEGKNKCGDDATKPYRRIRYQTEVALSKFKEIKNKHKQNPNKYTKEDVKLAEKKFKKLRSIKLNTTYGNAARLERKAVYVRYADDWVLAVTCNKTEAEIYKRKIAEYLLTERKMQLDDEKTKITRVRNGYHFLGFEVRMLVTNPRRRFVLQTTAKGKVRTLKRTTQRQITIEPHSDRILNRLKMNQFCNSKYEPRARPGWLIHEEYDIVDKYNQIFRGLYNYYLPCERLTRLNRISYILQYSCARTLARRRKISMIKIFRKYGKNLEIKKEIKNTKKENKTKVVRFNTLTNLRQMETKPSTNILYDDPFRIMQYWRTKMKIYNECCICGETKNVALHHLNSVKDLKKMKKSNSYQRIRSTINRLQIPVCHKCHESITHGKYNDPKKPIEFFNEFLAKL